MTGTAEQPEPTAASPAWRGPAWRAFKLLLLAVVLLWLGIEIYKNLSGFAWRDHAWEPAWLLAALAASVIGKGLYALTFHRALAAFGYPLNWPRVLRCSWLVPVAKYIPGRLASIPWLIFELKQDNVTAKAGLTSTTILSAMMLVISLPIGIWLLHDPIFAEHIPHGLTWAIVLLVLCAIVLSPAVLRRLINLALKAMKQPPMSDFLGLSDYTFIASVMLVQYVSLGFACWAVLAACDTSQDALAMLPTVIIATALSTTVGFLAFFAPGGIGAREGVLFLLLSPAVGSEVASLTAAGSRIVLVLAEAILAFMAISTGAVLSRGVAPLPRTR